MSNIDSTKTMHRFLARVFVSPGFSALLALCIALMVIVTRIAFRITSEGVLDLLVLVLPMMIVMLAALAYQLVQRKWLRALGSLALGTMVFFIVFAVAVIASLYQDSSEPWKRDSNKVILPDRLGIVTLQIGTPERYKGLGGMFVPGKLQEWSVVIEAGLHSPQTIILGDTMDSSTNLGVFLIDEGERRALRFNLQNKNYYFDLTHGHTVRDMHQEGRKLGTFFGGEFVAEYADHPKADGGLFHPCAVAVDGKGNVYMADATARLLVKYTESGQYITKWQLGSGADQGKLIEERYGIAVEGDESVWVAGWGDGILRKYISPGTMLRTTRSHIDCPWGLACGSDGYVYTTDRYGRLRKVSPSGKIVWTVGADKGAGMGGFHPTGVTVTPDGQLLVVNTNDGIEKYSMTGKRIAGWGIRSHHWFDDYVPADVKADESGNVYVAAWYRSVLYIEKYTSDGHFLLKWKPEIGLTGDGPVSIAAGRGFVYVADEKNHRVLKFTESGKRIEGWGL